MPKKVSKQTKVKLTLIERARLLLECFEGDLNGPKDRIIFRIDSPQWVMKIMTSFGFNGRSPNIITTYLIMRTCYTINLYPKTSKLEVIKEVLEDDSAHMQPISGEMIDWLKYVPSSWDYLTEAMKNPNNERVQAHTITLIAYRNYYRFIAEKVIEALTNAEVTK